MVAGAMARVLLNVCEQGGQALDPGWSASFL